LFISGIYAARRNIYSLETMVMVVQFSNPYLLDVEQNVEECDPETSSGRAAREAK
jgi:hypothetical protein